MMFAIGNPIGGCVKTLGLLGLGDASLDALVVANAAFTFQAFTKLLSHNG